ncbi:hypothetical protein [Sphingomonas sp.]|uniref:hypothetical protein n=1 Tax=Sphingomonas sp. TaxID=28214 RepID=UPI0018400A0E|nr:hypothetical protein [Sphingomonas sp.]MBA3511380.1 hypothetical protein [Sphingomonas sp.]
MTQGSYRYYCLDRVGQLHSAEWFEAKSDDDAIAQVEAQHPDSLCEIWQGQRLVAKLSSRPSPGLVRSEAARRALQA